MNVIYDQFVSNTYFHSVKKNACPMITGNRLLEMTGATNPGARDEGLTPVQGRFL